MGKALCVAALLFIHWSTGECAHAGDRDALSYANREGWSITVLDTPPILRDEQQTRKLVEYVERLRVRLEREGYGETLLLYKAIAEDMSRGTGFWVAMELDLAQCAAIELHWESRLVVHLPDCVARSECICASSDARQTFLWSTKQGRFTVSPETVFVYPERGRCLLYAKFPESFELSEARKVRLENAVTVHSLESN